MSKSRWIGLVSMRRSIGRSCLPIENAGYPHAAHQTHARTLCPAGPLQNLHRGRSTYVQPQRLVQPVRCPQVRTHATLPDTPRVLINDLRSQELVVDFNDGTATRYPSFWLRDHCPCTECTHPQTRQRQLDTFSLDGDTKAVHAESTESGLAVTWSDSTAHTSNYPWTWLRQHEPFTATPKVVNPRGPWQHVPVSPSRPHDKSWPYPTVDYEQAMGTDAGLFTLLNNIRTYGFTFISSTPSADPAPTEALANRVAYIRQTHYGGFWEVVSRINPTDTAYTNLYLPNHTDNTYFTDPCGLQMFHCLSHTVSETDTSEGKGGESTFVDGFGAAQKLHELNKDYYKILSNVRIVSHASGDPIAGSILNNAVHSTGFPVFTHLNPTSPPHPKNLSIVRWNNADRHSSTTFPSHQSMSTWYAAAKLWNELVHSPEFEIEVKLQPGMPIVFDNWRVLHGRKAFEGVRRLCGAYIGMDDFLGKHRLVRKKLAAAAGEDGDRLG